MKTLRIRLARWLARREERAARQTRRALRNHIRREEIQALAIERRARGLRLYATWSALRPQERALPACTARHPAAQSSGLSIFPERRLA